MRVHVCVFTLPICLNSKSVREWLSEKCSHLLSHYDRTPKRLFSSFFVFAPQFFFLFERCWKSIVTKCFAHGQLRSPSRLRNVEKYTPCYRIEICIASHFFAQLFTTSCPARRCSGIRAPLHFVASLLPVLVAPLNFVAAFLCSAHALTFVALLWSAQLPRLPIDRSTYRKPH